MIFLILILALILRLINLNQSLWLDEAVQAITAQNSLSYIFQEITGDFHPPLYYFLMHFWVRIFGSMEIALRVPSVLFGVGTVFILYKLTMHMHCRFTAVLVSFFLATAPFHIYYSQEARMYSMVTFFSTLSILYFIKILTKSIFNQQPSSKFQVQKPVPSQSRDSKLQLKIKSLNLDYFLYFMATLLLIYSDYFGFLILLAQGIYLLIKKKYKFFIFYFLFFIFYLPWLPMFVKQIKTGMLATQALPGWEKLVNVSFVKAVPLTLIKFTIGRITIFDKRVYSLVILGILGMLGVLGYKIYKCYKNYNVEKKDFFRIVFLWFSVPLVVSWIASLFIPNFQPFRLLLILPAFYLILVAGMENFNKDYYFYRFRIKSGMTEKLLIGLILTINLVSLGTYYFNPYFYREDWRGLVKYLQQQKDSVAILPSSASNWPIKYYDPEEKINLREGVSGVGEVREIGNIKSNKAYYIRYLVPLFDPNELILAKLEEQGYTKTVEVSFNQIPVWGYKLLELK